MKTQKIITVPTISVRFDPATGKFITNPNSHITLKVTENEDGSALCEVVRQAKN